MSITDKRIFVKQLYSPVSVTFMSIKRAICSRREFLHNLIARGEFRSARRAVGLAPLHLSVINRCFTASDKYADAQSGSPIRIYGLSSRSCARNGRRLLRRCSTNDGFALSRFIATGRFQGLSWIPREWHCSIADWPEVVDEIVDRAFKSRDRASLRPSTRPNIELDKSDRYRDVMRERVSSRRHEALFHAYSVLCDLYN